MNINLPLWTQYFPSPFFHILVWLFHDLWPPFPWGVSFYYWIQDCVYICRYTLIISLFSRVAWPAVTLCSSRPSGPSLDWFSWNCKSAKIENKSCNIQSTFVWIHDWHYWQCKSDLSWQNIPEESARVLRLSEPLGLAVLFRVSRRDQRKFRKCGLLCNKITSDK